MIAAYVVREDAGGEPYPYGNFMFEALPRVGDVIVIKDGKGSERHFVQSIAHFPVAHPFRESAPDARPTIHITTRTDIPH